MHFSLLFIYLFIIKFLNLNLTLGPQPNASETIHLVLRTNTLQTLEPSDLGVYKTQRRRRPSMEEPVPAQTTPTQLPNPPTTAQCPPPQPPAPTPHLPPKSKKRPLDTSVHIHNPKYFKMRAVLKELRPHFLEVQLSSYKNNNLV